MASKKKVFETFVIEDNVMKGVERKLETKFQSVGQYLLNAFDGNPNHVAQVEALTGRQVTYAEMRENGVRCALWLQEQGIGEGDVVVICTDNQSDAYIPCLGAFFAGAVYNPWHHQVPLKTARHLLTLTRPRIIFACEEALAVLRQAAREERVEADFVLLGKQPATKNLRDVLRLRTSADVQVFEQPSPARPDGVAMILFSSGTTGLPKGVAHSHRALLGNVAGFGFVQERCVSLWYSSLYWISGTYCMLQSLLTGATRVLHADFEPEETCRIIEKFQVSWFFMTPSIMTQLCKEKVFDRYRLDSLKTIFSGGSKISREVLLQIRKSLPGASVGQGYGMTELGGVATFQTKQCRQLDSVGFVVPNVQLKVIDVDDPTKTLGPNEEGEICVKSPTMMIGYYKNPKATRDIIDAGGWLHTGDKGSYSEIGELVILDRLKEIMKYRGHMFSTFEIEELLITHPGVFEVAVVPVPHEMDGEHPVAFVVKDPRARVTEEELVEMSLQLGDSRKLRGGVRFVAAIPHTASGKVSRKELKDMVKSPIN